MPKWMRTLAIVLSVLAAAYMISLIPRPSTRPKTPAVPQEIQRFSLISPGLSLTVENGDGGWRLTSPVDVPANDGMVVNFLSGLFFVMSENESPDEIRRPAEVGL